ncbi:MAG TPA: NB-ARC domain-containing protein [Candidatus Baltobacteraceae bacterium]|jgi:predicted ATPase|nr:NB-ARC domain-containing protein [Candidatus Baltobacteraceae bacterium]
MAQSLPRYTMPIVGREREVASTVEVLRGSHLVTIVGPGGIGKTRLAVEVAHAITDEGSTDGWFVDLAPVTDPQIVPHAVAAALGLELTPKQDPAEALVVALRNQNVLLVLDNCEHLLASTADFVRSIVAECPHVRVLATSREPLAVDGEYVYRLGTLDENAAMELFSEYALQADPSFSPSGRNLPVLRDICKRCDGIALAIVLAAANVRVMPLGQLRARLDGRFRLLVAGSRTLMLPRHQTMHALIDWSYDLLTEDERRVFRRFGVFSGTFDDEAAQAVVSGERAVEEPLGAVVDALVKKSMLVVENERYRMLESIRQYALEHLQTAGDQLAARSAHAAFFAKRAEAASDTFGEGSEEGWLARYSPDLDNFRAALDWLRDENLHAAATVAANLADFWEFNNLAGEGLRRSEVILAGLEYPDKPTATPLLLGVARLALAEGIYHRSYETAERARRLAEATKNERALAEARRISGRARYLLAIEPERSLWDLHDALDVIRKHEKPFAVARALRDYASALAQKDPVEGRKLLLEALRLAQSVGWPRLTAHVEINVAEREFRSGNVPSAVERARDVIEMLRRRRSPLQLGHALTNLAAYLSVNGQYDEAIAVAREAATIGRAHDTQNYLALPVQSAALVLATRGEPATAARLLGYVDAFYDRYGMKRELTEAIVYDRLLELLNERLSSEEMERERASGRRLDDVEVAALAFVS